MVKNKRIFTTQNYSKKEHLLLISDRKTVAKKFSNYFMSHKISIKTLQRQTMKIETI